MTDDELPHGWMSHERRVLLLAFFTGLPGSAVGLGFLWTGAFAPRLQWTVTILLVVLWVGSAALLREWVVRPLQTLSNLLGALREGDFSIRARNAAPDDALGLALLEVNTLGSTLRAQRLGAVEASALLRKVIAEIQVAVFAFDDGAQRRASGSSGCSHEWWHQFDPKKKNEALRAAEGGISLEPEALRRLEPRARTVLGLFAIPEVLLSIEDKLKPFVEKSVRPEGDRLTLKELGACNQTIARSTLLGSVIGIVPGVGQVVAALMAYAAAKSASPHPEKFGTGHVEGIVDAGASNNAGLGGAWVPALVFGAGAIGFFAVPYTIVVYPIVFLVLIRLWSVSHVHGFVTPADFVRADGRQTVDAVFLAHHVSGEPEMETTENINEMAFFDRAAVSRLVENAQAEPAMVFRQLLADWAGNFSPRAGFYIGMYG